MVKTFCKVVVVALVVVGALNFHALNKPAFKDITTTVTTKSLGEIPGKVLTTVTHHNWKFVKKS
jgi:hypothetical protein